MSFESDLPSRESAYHSTPVPLKIELSKFVGEQSEVGKDFFVANEPDGPYIIPSIGSGMGLVIHKTSAIPSVEGPTTLFVKAGHMDLLDTVWDKQILAGLGIKVGEGGEMLQDTDKSKLWSMQEIKILLKEQMFVSSNGVKDGDLKTDNSANLFYVASNDGQSVLAVSLKASLRSWVVEYEDCRGDWIEGDRVFLRN